MSIRDDIIQLKNGLVTLGDAIENQVYTHPADESVVNPKQNN